MSKKMKKKTTTITIAAALLIIILGVGAFLVFKPKDDTKKTAKKPVKTQEEVKEAPITIIDPESNSRPIGFMINNADEARTIQKGMSKAYIIYEILNYVDGRTRFLALYKDVTDNVTIGPIRSARIYHIDYALENDMIFVHWGYSPQAESAISEYKINNINGLRWGDTYFWTEKGNISIAHRRFTSMDLINKSINERFKYRTTTEVDNLLEYNGFNLTDEDGIKADTVKITYNSKTNVVEFKYNKDTGLYERYVNGKEHIDHNDNKILTGKNIIAYEIANSTISGDDSSRQELHNTGSGKAYYITNGYATEITWEKDKFGSQTVYKYQDGSEVKVNDGNTWIEIVPVSDKAIELG